MQASSELLIPSKPLPGASGETLAVMAEAVGFEFLTFRVRKLESGEQFTSTTGQHELGIVLLGGRLAVQSAAGNWSHIGGRGHGVGGVAFWFFFSIQTPFTPPA